MLSMILKFQDNCFQRHILHAINDLEISRQYFMKAHIILMNEDVMMVMVILKALFLTFGISLLLQV